MGDLATLITSIGTLLTALGTVAAAFWKIDKMSTDVVKQKKELNKQSELGTTMQGEINTLLGLVQSLRQEVNENKASYEQCLEDKAAVVAEKDQLQKRVYKLLDENDALRQQSNPE